jgi:LacI family transcriptional regulator
MPKKPTLTEVAKRAGVSLATASQVLRGVGRISQETRQTVQRAANDLNYIRDNRAASMRSGENHEIGMVIHRIANPFNAEVISGVSDCLEAAGYFVSILDSQNDPQRELRHLSALIAGARSGLLWVPAKEDPSETISLLKQHGIATVTFMRAIKDSPFDHVGIENFQGTYDGTSYLHATGHRRIAYFGGRQMTQVRRERIDGYLAAIKAHGLSDPIVWDCDDTKIAGLNEAITLLRQHPDVTALVCNGDMVALGASLALPRLGLRPGQDISVLGFDDITDAEVATPPLSTMAISPVQLGRRLAQTLLDRIQHPDQPRVIINTRAELVVRDTTSAPSRAETAQTSIT